MIPFSSLLDLSNNESLEGFDIEQLPGKMWRKFKTCSQTLPCNQTNCIPRVLEGSYKASVSDWMEFLNGREERVFGVSVCARGYWYSAPP